MSKITRLIRIKMRTRNKRKPDDGLWKERLGFGSGTLLIVGLALLRLYPMAAMVQLPDGLAILSPSGEAGTEIPVFSLLTVTLSLGGTVVVLAGLHIACRGLWLALPPDTSQGGSIRDRLNSICFSTFSSAFFAFFIFLLMVPVYPVMMTAVHLQRVLHHLLEIDRYAWGAVLYILCAFAVTAAVGGAIGLTLGGKRLLKSRVRNILEQPFRPFPGTVIFVLLANLFFFFTYTVALEVDDEILQRSKGDSVVVSLRLGGATSKLKPASLYLVNTSMIDRKLDVGPLLALGDGRYVSFAHSSTLSPGAYTIVLEYDHAHLDSRFPFFHFQIQVSKSFVVLE